MTENTPSDPRRFLTSDAGRRALKLYGLALGLALLGGLVYGGLVDRAIVICRGESCMMATVAQVLFILQWPGALLYRLTPHLYWDIENIPGFHLLHLPLCFVLVNYVGKGCAWLAKKRSLLSDSAP